MMKNQSLRAWGVLLLVLLTLTGCRKSGAPVASEPPEPGSPKWVAFEFWRGFFLGQDFALAWDLMAEHKQRSNYEGNKETFIVVWQRTFPKPLPTPEHVIEEQKVTSTRYVYTVRHPNDEIQDVQITVERDGDRWAVAEARRIE